MQTAIAEALPLLPPGMPSAPTFRKVNPADQPIFVIALSSDTRPLSDLDSVAQTLIAPQVAALNGVAQVNVLGGQNFGIASTSKHPELAFDAIMCMNSEYVQKLRARNKGQAPTLQSLYKDPALLKEFPHLATVAEGLEVGLNRPVTPYYNDVTIVIYRFYNDVLNGRADPKEAVAEMDRKIQKAIVGKAEI